MAGTKFRDVLVVGLLGGITGALLDDLGIFGYFGLFIDGQVRTDELSAFTHDGKHWLTANPEGVVFFGPAGGNPCQVSFDEDGSTRFSVQDSSHGSQFAVDLSLEETSLTLARIGPDRRYQNHFDLHLNDELTQLYLNKGHNVGGIEITVDEDDGPSITMRDQGGQVVWQVP